MTAPEIQWKTRIAEDWRTYWQTHPDNRGWDYTSEIVLEAIRREAGAMSGTSVLEAGCGTGRISSAIAAAGARVTCIDTSTEAIVRTRRRFATAGTRGDALVASLFDLPFATGSFDCVWNAGVLEHFSEGERAAALRELLRVTRPGGVLITLNPYKFALLYRVGKYIAEKTGRWPFGHEDPVGSLRAAGEGLPATLVREYSVGLYLTALESLRAAWPLTAVLDRLRTAAVTVHRGPLGGIARLSDRGLSRVIGGYLLVSTFRKHQSVRLKPDATSEGPA